MTKTVLSPIALSVRNEIIPGVRATDLDLVRSVCTEALEGNTADIALGSAEMKSVVASVVQGVLAALATSRVEAIEMAMHAIARYSSKQEGSDPNVVATVICDAASIIEVTEDEREPYLDSMVEAALSACDHLLGPERDELVAFLRSSLPLFLEKRAAELAEAAATGETDAS